MKFNKFKQRLNLLNKKKVFFKDTSQGCYCNLWKDKYKKYKCQNINCKTKNMYRDFNAAKLVVKL